MLDSVKDFLYRSATPEMGVLLETTDRLLSQLEIRSQDIALQQIMETLTTSTNIDAVNSVYTTYTDAAENIIRSHGIEYDNLSLPMMNTVIQGLLLLQDYEGVEEIADICDSLQSPVEKLHELLSITTGFESAEFEPFIIDVNPELLNKLLDLVAPELELLDVQTERLDTLVRDRALWWRTHYPDTHATAMISDNIPLGLDVDTYLNKLDSIAYGRLQDSPSDAAKELLGLLFISHTATADIHNRMGQIADDLFVELPFVYNVDAEVLKIMEVYNHG